MSDLYKAVTDIHKKANLVIFELFHDVGYTEYYIDESFMTEDVRLSMPKYEGEYFVQNRAYCLFDIIAALRKTGPMFGPFPEDIKEYSLIQLEEYKATREYIQRVANYIFELIEKNHFIKKKHKPQQPQGTNNEH